MKKVLLVDDEIFVRKGLRSLIDWKKCGFEVYDETDNGEDALELIKETSPDLVITDIRMPVLDGLELIKQVSTLEPKPKFIVISGFNDFKYAQHAIRYGVHDFILKPIDQDEMEAALVKLSEVLSLEETQSKNREHMLLNKMFDELLTGNVDHESLEQYVNLLGGGPSTQYSYAIIELFGSIKTNTDENGKSIIQQLLTSEFKSKIPLFEHQDGRYGFVMPSYLFKPKDVKNLTKQLALKLNGSFMIYVGKSVSMLDSLKESYETAKTVSLYKYSQPENSAILFEEVKELPLNYMELDQSLYVSLMEKIEENNHTSIEAVTDEIFQEYETKIFAPEAVNTSISRCVHGIIKTIKSMEGDETQLVSYEGMLKWQHYNLPLKELKGLFKSFVMEAAEMLSSIRKAHAQGDIRKIKQYIEKNFHENLSLKGIANLFYMNPVYMGQLFKKTYGVYFKEFLLELRTNEAKKLLRQTNLRVYEIAEKVGFGSTDYFVTQFEKMEGRTPTEYRNQVLK